MKKTKLEKGITLVALVITIIVLLILAVVAIGAVRDSGIIGHAQNSADRYNTGKLEEESMIVHYEDAISKYDTEGSFGTNGDSSGDGDIVEDEEKQEGGNGSTPVIEQKTLTLTTDTDSIFTTEFQGLFGGDGTDTPKNVAELTYKSGEYKLKIETDCHDTVGTTYLVFVTYYKNGEKKSSYALRGPSGYFNDDGSVDFNCMGYEHYVKGWNDISTVVSTCTCSGFSGSEVYGPLTQFPEFTGKWEIDTQNTNDYGRQFLQGILVEK